MPSEVTNELCILIRRAFHRWLAALQLIQHVYQVLHTTRPCTLCRICKISHTIAVSRRTTSFLHNVYLTEACSCKVCACRLDVLRQLTKTGFGVVDVARAADEAVVVEMGGMTKVYCMAAMQDLRVRVLMARVPMEEGPMEAVLMGLLMVVVPMALVRMEAALTALVRMVPVRTEAVLMVEVLTALAHMEAGPMEAVLMEVVLMEVVLMAPALMALVLMEAAPTVRALMLDQRTVQRMARTRLAMERSRIADMELRVAVNV